MNRNTEKRPPAFLKEMSAKEEIRVTPDYTNLVNDVTDGLCYLTEHLKTLKDQLEPILKYDPSTPPTTKETEDTVGQSQFRTDMTAIVSVIRLITDEVNCISHAVDL